MKWLLSILALVFSVEVHAQPSPINRRAMVISGLAAQSFDPSQIGGMLLRLRASDNVVGNKVQTWTDEIHGFTWTNNTTSLQPSNSTKGVWFTINQFLESHTDPGAYWPTQQLFIVFQWNNRSGYGTIMGQKSLEKGVGIVTVPGGFGNETPTRSWTGNNITPAADIYHDVICEGGSDPVKTYTNGVAGVAQNMTADATQITFDRIGNNQAGTGGDFYQGYIAEIIVWTNSTKLSATDVANLHKYATNTYQYSP